jgi:medium-chain acyl-[acyl-carrier-protein] hydrolase
MFRRWSDYVGSNVEICAVTLPGRGSRADEPPQFRIDSLVASLANGIAPKLDRPYALFGHSLGALIAFELTACLATTQLRPPQRLFVSACPAPCRRGKSPGHQNLSDRELTDLIARLNGLPDFVANIPELLAITLQIVRADFALSDSYQAAGTVVDCPITALFGERDPRVDRRSVADWRRHTRGGFSAYGIPGDHFFCNANAGEVVTTVLRELR